MDWKERTLIVFLFLFYFFKLSIGQEIIHYKGSSTVGVFIKNAAKYYQEANFIIDTSLESKGGEFQVLNNTADLGGVAREVRETFSKRGLQKHLIGKDIIAVWVHKSNPINNLSSEQLRDIFTGKINNWQQVEGSNLLINIYLVNSDSATRKVFQESLLKGERYKRNLTIIKPDAVVLNRIAFDQGGIGPLSFAIGVDHSMKNRIKKISINQQNIDVGNKDYPIFRPLYLTTRRNPKESVRKFIKWALSDRGQAIVKKHFLSIK